MSRVNIANVERKDFTPPPAGTYKLKCTDTENKITQGGKNPGSDMVTLTWTIQEGPEQGKNIWDNFVFIDSTAWRFVQLADALGLDADEFDSDTFGDLIEGQEVTAKIKVRPENEEYDAQAQIRKYLAPDEAPSQSSSLLS
jgi:hypothetical protein